MTSRKPSARSGSCRNTRTRTKTDQGSPHEVVDQRQPQSPHVAAGPDHGLDPQVDHHRVDHQEHRDRGQGPDPVRVPSGPAPKRVTDRRPAVIAPIA